MCIDLDGLRAGAGQRGATLIELIVFMIIISVGVVGLVSVTGSLTRDSADPMLRKQMLAIAESLLNETLHQPLTYCDPDDANFATATSTAGCFATSQDKDGVAALSSATPSSETRYATAPAAQFDNVADYGGATSANGRLHSPIDDITGGNPVAGYTAAVVVTRAGTAFGLAKNGDALQVTVTVSHAGQDDFSLTGYRFRYAPRN